MKNYWVPPLTTSLGFCRCSDKVQGLPPSKLYLISWTTPSVCMEKFDCKQYVRTLVRVRSVISWVMKPILDSGQATAKNMEWLSKKATTVLLKGKWNCSNFYILKS